MDGDVQGSGEKTPAPRSAVQGKGSNAILFAFWAVVVLLGVPLWLWTTSIHRANLPMESMNEWSNGKVCDFYGISRLCLTCFLGMPAALSRLHSSRWSRHEFGTR